MHNKERKDKHKESRWCVSFFSLCSLLWPLSTIWALDTSRWCVSFFSVCSLLWSLPTIWALDTGYCMWLRVLKRFSEKKILTSLGHCNESLSPVRVTLESPSQLMHRSASAPGAITHSIFPTQELIYKSSTLLSLANTIGSIAFFLFGINHPKSCSKRHFTCILLNTYLFDFDVCVTYLFE